jgi:hypothetical protein
MDLWSVQDFKAYNIFAGWSVHGELRRLICGSDTDYFHLTHGDKISYFNCHRRWLPQKHKIRQEQNTFKNDTIVTKGLPKRLSGTQVVDMLDKLTPDLERPGYFEGYGETHNWTHKCATTNSGIVIREIDAEGRETNYYGIINKIPSLVLLGIRNLK